MKMNFLNFRRPHSEECESKVRFKPASFALALMSACATFVPSQAVHAQGASGLEEIIVTARKREESLQETPVVVNVLTSESLSASRIEGIKDLGTIVPGLVTTESTASTAGLIFLRGVGTGSLSPLFDQAVSINIDGVGISSASLLNAGMFDLDRVEVLRGPQALFFGKNSPGGVIALHTKDPSDEFEFEVTAMYETEGEEPAVRAVVSGPLSETVSGRLSVGWSDADKTPFDVHNFDVFEPGPAGLVQTAAGTSSDPVQTEKTYVMGTLLWEPNDDFTAKLKVAHLEDNQDGHHIFNFQRTQCPNGPQVLYPAPGVDNCALDGDVVSGGINPVVAAGDPNFGDHTGDGFANNEDDFISLEINYALSDTLDLTSVTGYYDNYTERFAESSFQVASGLINSVTADIEQVSQEFRINSNYDGNVNFAAGVYYEDKSIYQSNAVTIGSVFAGLPVSAFGLFPIPIGQQFVEQDTTAYSVFGQINWDISDKLTLAAGARYSYEEKDAIFQVNHFAIAPDGGPKLDVPLLDANPDWSNVSPEVTLSYQYTDDIMFFASAKTGFKSGGFDAAWKPGTLIVNALTGAPYDNIYDEEEAEGIEFGMKSDLLDGTLRFNATAYYYEYDGLQLSQLSAGEGGIPSIRVQNAASGTVQGLELETLWLTPVEGLQLTANIAYNNAEYDDYIADCFTGQTIAQGCTLNPGADGRFTGANMNGEPLSNAPEWNATFALDYFVPVSSNWNLALNVTSAFTDDYNPTSSLYPESYWQDSYWLHNASVTLSSEDEKLSFFVRAINLGDEYYSATGSNAPFTGSSALTGTNIDGGQGDFFQFVNGGRQFMIGATYRM